MNKKKSVIFHISNNKQYFGEFHENTPLKMVKSYLKDISHMEDFQLIVNGEVSKDDEIIIRDLFSHYNRNEIIFKVVQNNSAINELTEEFMKENHLLRDELDELTKQNNQLNDDNSKITYNI